ncbi:unnamed protein product [Schistocephalus solidus]|uniref:Solute carrier family 2, facilitated glucose transporter member 3 n=1 Tax=Schistocephalus solidus TaxID=70667 RepID=A0A183SIA2_SCHSO|nr:unnamed protein product [Schistocephalus solidus]
MLNLRFVYATFVIAFGSSFQFGYQTGVINAPIKLMEDFIRNVTLSRNKLPSKEFVSAMSSLIVAGFPIGGVFGALIGSPMSNKMGRKLSLFILNVPMAAGSLLMMCSVLANTFEMIIVGRVLVGLACGAFTAIAPVYLAEIAPVSIRGAAGIVHQLAVVTALLISQIFGLTEVMGTATLWPYLLGLTIIPSVVLLLLLWTCPDSPRYILLNPLQWYRGPNVNVEEELEELLKEHVDSGRQKFSLINLFKTRHLRSAILIAIVAHLSQQFSGINAALFYSTALFLYIKFTPSEAAYATLGVGGTMVIVTLISIFLIERLGRRKLLLPGLGIMFACTILITIGLAVRSSNQNVVYLAIASIYVFVGGFAIGPGSIPWFIVAEMFVQETRDAAILVTVLVNWISQIIVSLGYMQLLAYLKDFSFIPFTVLLAIFIALLYRYLPETNGRSPREVEEDFLKATTRGLSPVSSQNVQEVDRRHGKSSDALIAIGNKDTGGKVRPHPRLVHFKLRGDITARGDVIHPLAVFSGIINELLAGTGSKQETEAWQWRTDTFAIRLLFQLVAVNVSCNEINDRQENPVIRAHRFGFEKADDTTTISNFNHGYDSFKTLQL